VKLRTIWTMPAMTLRERLRRSADAVDMAIAWRLPKRVRYWAFVYTALDAAKPEMPSGMLFDDVHKRVRPTPRS
jgi:hypothetical protein